MAEQKPTPQEQARQLFAEAGREGLYRQSGLESAAKRIQNRGIDAVRESIQNSIGAQLAETFRGLTGRDPTKQEFLNIQGQLGDPTKVAASKRRQRLPDIVAQFARSQGMTPQAGKSALKLAQADIQRDQAIEQQEEEAKQQEEQFLRDFRNAIKGQEDIDDAAKRIGGELGLPTLRDASSGVQQEIIDLRQQLSQLPEQVQKERSPFGVSAGRLQARTRAEADPMRGDLSNLGFTAQSLGEQLTSAEQQLTKQLGFLTQQQEKELLPFEQEAELLSDRLARKATNFQFDQQAELETLLTQIEQGFQLERDELERAHDLAIMEQQFENQKGLLKRQANQNIRQERETSMLPGRTSQVVQTGEGVFLITQDEKGNIVGRERLGSRPVSGSGTGESAILSRMQEDLNDWLESQGENGDNTLNTIIEEETSSDDGTVSFNQFQQEGIPGLDILTPRYHQGLTFRE